MDTWFIYALLSSIFAGLYTFSHKISANKNYNSSKVTFYSMISTTITALFFVYFTLDSYSSILIILLFAFGNITMYFISIVTRIDALKSIDSTIYLPLYKIFSSLIVFIIGFLLFNDRLTYIQILGVLIGISIPLLLVNKAENKRQKNLKLGLILLSIGIITSSISSSIGKYFSLQNLNIPTYIFLSFFIGSFYSYFLYNSTRNLKHGNDNIKLIGVISGVFAFFGMYYFVKALIDGPIIIVYLLNSFSIIITILLSVIFYKEHFSFKKFIALLLTIIATILLR